MRRLFYSFPIRLWLGVGITASIPYIILSPWSGMFREHAFIISMFSVAVTHWMSAKFIFSITKYPGHLSPVSVLPNSIFWFGLVWAVLWVLRLPYSLWFLFIGFLVSFLVCFWGFKIRVSRKAVWAYLPFAKAKYADRIPGAKWIKLDRTIIPVQSVDGYVVDLHSPDFSPEWQKFLAEETLRGVPVYHIRYIEEMMTGRVKIHHMYENNLGSLQPSESYMWIKHFLDSILIVCSLPLIIPLLGFFALLIKLEDGGAVFYKQKRIGHRGKIITVYKLRSMREKSQEYTTYDNDNRITRVGWLIRKSRIDEIPQFLNVLKGEMSLIGPRAEFKDFADSLEKQVPFYQYRHIVKPGISGWAQVMHGYATGAEETQIKIEHDFYYIKHFSFSLDVLIFFKTIKTMLTGFGAR
ncbi:MAG: sugar transferase [Eikenella sp.]|nr:sugar transferase [Eikenella sp.]